MSGLMISGALGALASTSTLVLAVRAPSGGGLSAVPLTVIVKLLPVVGRAVVSERGGRAWRQVARGEGHGRREVRAVDRVDADGELHALAGADLARADGGDADREVRRSTVLRRDADVVDEHAGDVTEAVLVDTEDQLHRAAGELRQIERAVDERLVVADLVHQHDDGAGRADRLDADVLLIERH